MRRYRALLYAVPIICALLACTCKGQKLLPISTPSPYYLLPPPSLVPPTPLPDAVVSRLEAEDELLANIYQRASPAVVYIEAMARDGSSEALIGSGSGFVIDAEGHIVTNAHVIEQADSLEVSFADGTVVAAEVLGKDPYSDLAVLRVEVAGAQLWPLELGDSDTLRVGQRVIAIGNPFGLEGTMTVGIISALGRSLPSQVLESAGYFSNPDIIQTDAAINPGNSGGPLLDLHGRVVGVNTAIRSTTGVNAGVGFAVPVNTLKRIVPHLIKEGTYHYPYLGITSDTRFTVAELAEPLGLPVTYGVLVTSVQPGTGAARAGLRGGDHEVEVKGMAVRAGGDLIIAINGYRLRSFDDLVAYLVRETEVGQEVTLTIIRNGELMDVPVVLGER
ncbi:MAG: trypsin-like peptidase domain-containing protein [Anaerolineae bacterium]|nr:trypsin-like peptidase domain-containing protein [Anaerolineae bacterium]